MPDHALGFQIVPPSRQFKFGAFQVDSRTGELRKHGIKIRIGQQTFELLLMLLEHPGEAVLREDIRLKLWPNDTVVEFDHSINAAVQKLRAALGESAGSPLYIETLARRGYRFVGTVETTPVTPASAPAPPPEPEIEEPVAGHTAGGANAAVPRPSRRWIPWAAAAVLASLAFLVGLRMGPAVARAPRLALTIVPPPDSHLPPAQRFISAPEISPDGSSVLYAATAGLWVRRLDSLDPKFVPGSEERLDTPFWSADSQTVVFRAHRGLVKVRVPDGAPELITQFRGFTRGGSWGDDGVILLSHLRRLYAVPASGGELKPVEVPGMKPGIYDNPEFLPGSEDFLFLFVPDDGEGTEIYLATLRGGKVVNPTLLMKNDTAASYTPAGGGRILFVRNDNLYSQRLNRNERRLDGDAELLQTAVASMPGLSRDRASFSVSRSGVLAWRPGKAALNQVTIFDREGREIGTAGPQSGVNSVLLSPDETRLLAGGSDDGAWLLNPGQSGRLGLGKAWFRWQPDGSHLLVQASSGRLEERSIDGSGAARALGEASGELEDISPDGKEVLAVARDRTAITVSRLEGTAQERAPRTVVHTNEGLLVPSFSPDGRWVVYMAVSPGGAAIYVQPLGTGMRTQIASPSSYGAPVWRKDGKEILTADSRGVWSVSVEAANGGLRFGAPQLLFSGPRPAFGINGSTRPLAVSRDGSRIFLVQGVEQPISNVINVSMGWDSK